MRTPTANRRLAADALGGWVAPLVTTTTRTTRTTVVAGIATAHCRALPAPRRIGISSSRYDAIAITSVHASCTKKSGHPVIPVRSALTTMSTGQCQRYTP